MNELGKVRLGVTFSAVMALAACQGDMPFAGKTEPVVDQEVVSAADSAMMSDDVASGVIAQAGGERDVKAPQIFELTDQALWDGRPSLGGIWAAHTSVTDPERVLIRNTANGETVVGALFRREFDNPGPSIQLSSDAAEALGMLAGQPGTVEIVALKRIEEPAAEAAPAASAAIADKAGTDDKTEATAATAPKAAATQNAGTSTIKPAAKPAKAGATDSAALAANAAAAIDKAEGKAPAAGAEDKAIAPDQAMAKSAQKETWKERRARHKAEREAARAAKAAKKSGTAVAAAGAAGGAAISATTIAPAAAPASKPAAATAKPAVPAPAPAGETLLRPYIQVGIFSSEANAGKAKAELAKTGMSASVKPDQSQGKSFWRVIVGPAASVPERDQLVIKVKGMGYPDAYPVKQ